MSSTAEPEPVVRPGRTVRSVAGPARVGERPPGKAPRAPQRGEHTVTVLRDLLGYDADRPAGLRAKGAFGD